MALLRTTWQVRICGDEPVAVVRVRNLQTTLAGGTTGTTGASVADAWGRYGRSQPLWVSAEVSLATAFPEASATDRVATDTVHYGVLSKAILESVAGWQGRAGGRGLRGLLEAVWADLTGCALGGERGGGESEGGGSGSAAAVTRRPPPLPAHMVRLLSLSLHLPKASLVGDGVTLTATAAGLPEPGRGPVPTAVALRLHQLRVPTLVGVHPHERTAKQAVVADVTVERFQEEGDLYGAMERVVVETLETSSFETLEALATQVAVRVHALAPTGAAPWQVQVELAKPLAVASADAPVVEVRL